MKKSCERFKPGRKEEALRRDKCGEVGAVRDS
jgi:hypothetical protein